MVKFFYRPQRSWGKVISSEACVNNSVHRGGGAACMVLFGGHAWFYLGGMRGFIWGGVHGFIWGACVVLFGGHAWFYSGGVCGFFGYNEIWSMSGRYASYWNAFLFTL